MIFYFYTIIITIILELSIISFYYLILMFSIDCIFQIIIIIDFAFLQTGQRVIQTKNVSSRFIINNVKPYSFTF